MMIPATNIYEYCSVPYDALESHPDRKIPFKLVRDSEEMGEYMAKCLVDEIIAANRDEREIRAIVPCGPKSWYPPFARMINQQKVSLKRLTVFHMDECLDWNGNPVPANHPHNFHSYMEKHFYGDIPDDLNVPASQRVYPSVGRIEEIKEMIASKPVDITLGGWGQDGHIAYNQAKRNPFIDITLDQLRNLSIHVQENNIDTIMALAQRDLGCAYQLVSPQSITLGIKECLSAKKIRLFSDTGAWKATALRVALFGDITAEYPMTLLQEHADAMLVATISTATHPISEHPEWQGVWS